MNRSAILLFFLMINLTNLFAQKGIFIQLTDSLPKEITYEKRVADKDMVQKQAAKIISQLMNKGYLVASIDTIQFNNDTALVKIYPGRIFNWGNIGYKYLPEPMLNQFGFNQNLKGMVKINDLKKSMTQTIGYFENRGYPFAYFYWDSLVIKNDTVLGSLYFEKNIFISFDTLAIYGDAGITKRFLYNYLGFLPGQAYSESLILQINDKLKKLPFASLAGKPQFYFVERKVIVLLNLKKRKTDRLDGIVGFAPNTGLPNDTKLLVTGEFHLDFKNLKGSGTGIKIDWQSFKVRSQTLNMSSNIPYLLNKPIGLDIAADFLKYDTIYTETRLGIGTQYLFSGLDHLKFFYEQKNTTLQAVDTINIRKTRKLGNLTSMKTNRYGLAFNRMTFNNRINPSSGYMVDLNASIFKRTIIKDFRINDVKFFNTTTKTYYTVYDSVSLISYQLLLQYNLAKPIMLSKKWILYNELFGYHFISPQIYFNELYRFGGNKSLRGFNEQSLFASSVSIYTLEVRYLLSENSFLKVFGNTAYYLDKSDRNAKISSDIPYGFGGGLNIDTGTGIFNLSVALGKSKYNPIDFKNSKVHFGLINYF